MININESAGLKHHELEQMVFAIETSLKINKRFQFFLWAQGTLQVFIPHEILVCAYGNITRKNFRYEIFSRTPVTETVRDMIGDPVSGLLVRSMDCWISNHCAARLLNATDSNQHNQKSQQLMADTLLLHEMEFAMAHGPMEIRGNDASFFLFLRMPDRPQTRSTYLLELFMPYLHMSLYRMLAHETDNEAVTAFPSVSLSDREIQVLQWMQNGKTNREIGDILKISPFTVKNHVQKILRKLNVSNRAHAVGKGAASRLLLPGEPDLDI
jgi:transcriptional regulator EpsA